MSLSAKARDEPLEIELGVVAGHALDEIEAWLVASGENMGDTGPRYADGVGELGLADVFDREKLLKTLVHFSSRIVYKSNKSFPLFQVLQMAIVYKQ